MSSKSVIIWWHFLQIVVEYGQFLSLKKLIRWSSEDADSMTERSISSIGILVIRNNMSKNWITENSTSQLAISSVVNFIKKILFSTSTAANKFWKLKREWMIKLCQRVELAQRSKKRKVHNDIIYLSREENRCTASILLRWHFFE